jgi:hypothetical protein
MTNTKTIAGHEWTCETITVPTVLGDLETEGFVRGEYGIFKNSDDAVWGSDLYYLIFHECGNFIAVFDSLTGAGVASLIEETVNNWPVNFNLDAATAPYQVLLREGLQCSGFELTECVDTNRQLRIWRYPKTESEMSAVLRTA